MGGSKTVQNDSTGAAQAKAGAFGAANTELGYAGQNQNWSNQIMATLFGKPAAGKTPAQGGSLTAMLDPNNPALTSARPTGYYNLAFNQGKKAISSTFNNANATVAQQAANRGFGFDSNFAADAKRKNALDMANSTGQAYAEAVGGQHSEALQNFWNATGTAAGQAASTRGTAAQEAASAGQTYGNVYGSGVQTHEKQSALGGIVGSAIGAGGTVGAAAMCPAEGAEIALEYDTKKVQDLDGSEILSQHHGQSARLTDKPVPVEAECVRVTTQNGLEAIVSETHTFMLIGGGYVYAKDSANALLPTRLGGSWVIGVVSAGKRKVYPIKVGGNHTYMCDGIWSLE